MSQSPAYYEALQALADRLGIPVDPQAPPPSRATLEALAAKLGLTLEPAPDDV